MWPLPKFRVLKVTDLHVGIILVISGQRDLAINFWQTLHSHFAVKSQQWLPYRPLAHCFCPLSECRHLSCVVPSNDLQSGRRKWRSRWWSAVHWDQSSRQIRRTEAEDCLHWHLDRRGRRCGLFLWWLAALHGGSCWKDEQPSRENKAAGCHFLPKQPTSVMILTSF